MTSLVDIPASITSENVQTHISCHIKRKLTKADSLVPL